MFLVLLPNNWDTTTILLSASKYCQMRLFYFFPLTDIMWTYGIAKHLFHMAFPTVTRLCLASIGCTLHGQKYVDTPLKYYVQIFQTPVPVTNRYTKSRTQPWNLPRQTLSVEWVVLKNSVTLNTVLP